MIQRIEVTNPNDETLIIDMYSPETSGFIVSNIDGLGPVKNSMSTTELTTSDGVKLNHSRLSSRNIVFNLRYYDASMSCEELRLNTYRYFPIKKKVKIVIKTDKRYVETYGYVESNEPNIFDNECGSTISVMCPDPYFYSTGDNGLQYTEFRGVYPLFEFPFYNESSSKDIELSSLYLSRKQSIYYAGDTDVGLDLKIGVNGPVKELKIFNETTGEWMSFNDNKIKGITGAYLDQGDIIYVHSIVGEKRIRLERNGKTYNIMNSLDRKSKWLQLIRGVNEFAYSVADGSNYLSFVISNRVRYEGV